MASTSQLPTGISRKAAWALTAGSALWLLSTLLSPLIVPVGRGSAVDLSTLGGPTDVIAAIGLLVSAVLCAQDPQDAGVASATLATIGALLTIVGVSFVASIVVLIGNPHVMVWGALSNVAGLLAAGILGVGAISIVGHDTQRYLIRRLFSGAAVAGAIILASVFTAAPSQQISVVSHPSPQQVSTARSLSAAATTSDQAGGLWAASAWCDPLSVDNPGQAGNALITDSTTILPIGGWTTAMGHAQPPLHLIYCVDATMPTRAATSAQIAVEASWTQKNGPEHVFVLADVSGRQVSPGQVKITSVKVLRHWSFRTLSRKPQFVQSPVSFSSPPAS